MIVPMLVLSGFSAYYAYLYGVPGQIFNLNLPTVWYGIASVNKLIILKFLIIYLFYFIKFK
jgi:hypothetical protein